MQQIYLNTKGLKRAVQKAQLEEYLSVHPETALRWDAVRNVLDGVLTQKQAASVYKVTERTVQRWLAQYDGRHPISLAPKSKQPHKTPRAKVPHRTRIRVIQVAGENPSWGGDIVYDYMVTHALSPPSRRTCERILAKAGKIDLSQPIESLQEEINAWLVIYNTERPHQHVGRRPPIVKLFQFHLQNFIQSTQRDSVHLRHMLWRGRMISYSFL